VLDAHRDPRVFQDGPEIFAFGSLSEDGRYLLITVYYGSAAPKTDLYFQNLAENGPILPLVTDIDARFSGDIGGDHLYLQTNWNAPNGRVLSSWPASLLTVTCLPARRLVDASGATYCYQQGTSMAAPHAAGVAALLASRGLNSRAIAAKLGATSDSIACPTDLSIYDFFPAVDGGAPQTCTGGPAFNSFYGQGQVNALSAVTR